MCLSNPASTPPLDAPLLVDRTFLHIKPTPASVASPGLYTSGSYPAPIRMRPRRRREYLDASPTQAIYHLVSRLVPPQLSDGRSCQGEAKASERNNGNRRGNFMDQSNRHRVARPFLRTEGPGHVPRGTFTFVKVDLKGTSPKKDQNEVKWKIKLGAEARPETVASRGCGLLRE
jgi:hypothetical protein